MCNELTALPCFHQTLGSVMENLPHTNMAELLISLVCLAVLVPVKEINTRFRQRLRTPIPVEILTVSQQDLGINSGCSDSKTSRYSISYGPMVFAYCFFSVRQLYFFLISLHEKTNMFPHIRFRTCICHFANFVTNFSHGSCIICHFCHS